MEGLQGQAGAQMPLERPLDGVLGVALAGKRHWVDLGAFPVDTSRDVDVAERASEVFRTVAAVTLLRRVRGTAHVGGARLSRALVQDGLAPVTGEALLAGADGLVPVARGHEAADVGGDQRASLLDDDDVLALPAAGFATVFSAFVLLGSKKMSQKTF